MFNKLIMNKQPLYETEFAQACGLMACCTNCGRVIFKDELTPEQYQENNGICPDCINEYDLH